MDVLFGWATLAAVLAAVFVFSVVFHYVFPTPVHVAYVPDGPWKLAFEVSAGAVTIVDGAGALVTTYFARRARPMDG